MKPLVVVTCTLITAVWFSPALPKTVHVPGDQPTISTGLGVAVAGDTVLVACGTYQEYGIRMKPSVTLLSATGDPNCVTIDAQSKGRVIDCRYLSTAARIEGFTITGGSAIAGVEDSGGGIRCIDLSSPWIVNCVITGNFCNYDGGGIYCYNNSAPKIINCVISNNTAKNGGDGVRCDLNSPATITNCTISNNGEEGVWLSNSSSSIITGCTLSGSMQGLRAQLNGTGQIMLTDCTITGNGDTGHVHSNGVLLWNSRAVLSNCLITDNVGQVGAGIGCIGSSKITLSHCTLQNNFATSNGGAFYLEQGTSELVAEYTKFINNTTSGLGDNGFAEAGTTATLTCSVSSLDGFTGDGTFVLNNEGCEVQAVQQSTWGAVKALYR